MEESDKYISLENFFKSKNESGEITKMLDEMGKKNDYTGILKILDEISGYIKTIDGIGEIKNIINEIKNKINEDKLRRTASLNNFLEVLKSIINIGFDHETQNHHRIIINRNFYNYNLINLDDKYNKIVDEFKDSNIKVKQFEIKYNQFKNELVERMEGNFYGITSIGFFGSIITYIMGYMGYEYITNEEKPKKNDYIISTISVIGLFTTCKLYNCFKKLSTNKLVDAYIELVDSLNNFNK